MTNEEKEKAIGALKISAPIIAMTQEEFNDYIQTLNKIMDYIEQEPKKCKDCKWWKDSDGVYRRGVKAESRCPINTVSVANGWGYCYMFEPQERSDKE